MTGKENDSNSPSADLNDGGSKSTFSMKSDTSIRFCRKVASATKGAVPGWLSEEAEDFQKGRMNQRSRENSDRTTRSGMHTSV
jgi:hypothetical protein